MALSSSCASSASSCVQTAQSRRRGASGGSKIGSRVRRGGAACSALPNERNWGDANTQAVLEGRDSRRQVLTSVGAALTGIIASNGAFETVSPVGGAAMAADFAVVTDAKKGYVFAYPFGWQEVQVDGQEAVYKDVIESLESLSLTVTSTEKKSIDDFGTPVEAANLFLDKVLTSPATTNSYKLLESRESSLEGYKYYQLEYEQDIKDPSGRPKRRHAISTCVVGNEKLYLLTVGASDRRWGKMGDRLKKVANSLKLLY